MNIRKMRKQRGTTATTPSIKKTIMVMSLIPLLMVLEGDHDLAAVRLEVDPNRRTEDQLHHYHLK